MLCLLHMHLQVRLMRVVLLVKLLARGELFPRSSSRLLSVSSLYLISLVFSALATINLLACVWYATGSKSHQQVTWMDDAGGRDISGDPKWVKYLAAVYFTVRWGRSHSMNTVRMHTVCCMLCAACYEAAYCHTLKLACTLRFSAEFAHAPYAAVV